MRMETGHELFAAECPCSPFRIQDGDVASIQACIRKVDLMTSLSLKDAYLQILIHPKSRVFVCYILEDMVYYFKVKGH